MNKIYPMEEFPLQSYEKRNFLIPTSKNFSFVKVNPYDEKAIGKYLEMLSIMPKGSTFAHKCILPDGQSAVDRIYDIHNQEGYYPNFFEWAKDKDKQEVYDAHRKLSKKVRNFVKNDFSTSKINFLGMQDTTPSERLESVLKYNNLEKAPNVGMYFVYDKLNLSTQGNPKLAGVIGMVVESIDSQGKPKEVELVIHLKEPYTKMGLGQKLIEKIGTDALLTACKNKEFNQKAMICIETLKSNQPSLKMQNKAGLSGKKDSELVQNDKTVVQKFPVTTLESKMKLAKAKNSLCCFR